MECCRDADLHSPCPVQWWQESPALSVASLTAVWQRSHVVAFIFIYYGVDFIQVINACFEDSPTVCKANRGVFDEHIVMSVCFWQKESLILTYTVGSSISTPRSPAPGL